MIYGALQLAIIYLIINYTCIILLKLYIYIRKKKCVCVLRDLREIFEHIARIDLVGSLREKERERERVGKRSAIR